MYGEPTPVNDLVERMYDDGDAVNTLRAAMGDLDTIDRDRGRWGSTGGAGWPDENERQEAVNRVRASLIYLTREEDRD